MPIVARSFSRLVAARLSCVALLALATPLAAQTADQAAVQIAASVTAAPPSITLTWPFDATATGYNVARRVSGQTGWGSAAAVPGGGAATTWTDTTAAFGTRYDYWVNKGGNPTARGFVTAGIQASAIESRGKLVLLVDANQVTALGTRLDRLIDDLTGDGWVVLRHDVLPVTPVPVVRSFVVNDAALNPGQVKAVFVLGHVPVPYSGTINPDGHPDHFGAWPADVYYGELNGPWTDTAANTVVATRLENRNVPGDGKFDQSNIPSDVDLQVGRVDFANMPSFALSETQLLQQYLDKDHDYRHKVFAPAQRAVIDDNFGWFGGEAFAASGWRAFSALVGAANVTAADYFGTLNTTSGPGYVWSYGCGGGSYNSAGGIGTTFDFTTSTNRSVFTMLFGSYFGDWDAPDNFLRAPLCSGWTLTNMWAGRPHCQFHPMGMGETIGACARLSQNETVAGGFGGRSVHIALMGDPTLRQHVVAPPTNVAVVDLWPQANVTWSASSDAVAGYHVYRATSPQGPFTRLTTFPVAGTQWIDPTPVLGASTYMVRAIRLEQVPTGSYWNLSQGVFSTQTLPQIAATHRSRGVGCYTRSDSFWQSFATPAAASAVLHGNAITLMPANGSYVITSGGAFVLPSGAATALALGDDTAAAVALSQPLAYPGGSTTTLHVHANGIVSTSPLAMSAAASALPTAASLLGEAATAWYCWHDFDPTEPGSGSVLVEEANGTLYVTWNGVESHPGGVANASTQQLQFEFATGVVRYVWPALSAVGSDATIVGWSPGGASVDAGPLDLATELPFAVSAQNQEALRLAAGPAPVSTATTGTLLTYTVDRAPELSAGAYAAFTILSFTADAGTPLAWLGMLGCTQYIGTPELFLFAVGSSPLLTTNLQIPAGIPPGTVLYAQALALIPPGSQNAFGGVISNSIETVINNH